MRFLSDKPPDKDYLSTHYPIAQALVSQVEAKHQGSFVIGLFGDWGTGKTSIMKWFKELIAKNKKVTYAEVDAWKAGEKYFAVSFIRGVIYNCVPPQFQKKLLKLIATKQTTRHSQPEMEYADILLLCMISAFVVLIYLLPHLYIFIDKDLPWVAIATFIFGGGIVLLGQYYLNNIAVRTDLTEEDISLEQSDRFSKILIEDILPLIKSEICCVLVDNIDRLEAKEALDVIRKLKTYIIDEEKLYKQKKQFVIIVPVDDRLLVQHIDNLREKHIDKLHDDATGFESGRQFIRKFFNISIRIPEPTRTDLYPLTRGWLIEAYDDSPVPENIDEVAFIINRGAHRNPRDVKNLINEYVSLLFLLQTKKDENVVKELMANPQWIAFFSSLGFLSGYKKIATATNRLNDLIIEPNEYSKVLPMEQRISDFLSSTTPLREEITPEAWQWLIYNKPSENLIKFPNFLEIYDKATANNEEETWKLIQGVTGEKLSDLFKLLLVQAPGDNRTLINICSTIIKLLDLGVDQKDVPGQVITTIEYLLRYQEKIASPLVIGPLTILAKRLSKRSFDSAIRIAGLQAEEHSNTPGTVEFSETEIPDWINFLTRYISMPESGKERHEVPASTLSTAVRFCKPFATLMVNHPGLVDETVAEALANRTETDDLFFNEDQLPNFLSGIGEQSATAFYTRILPIFYSRLTTANSPDKTLPKSLYLLAIHMFSSGPNLGESYKPHTPSLVQSVMPHISTRNKQDSLLTLMVINSIKSRNISADLNNACTTIQNQVGAGIYQSVDPIFLSSLFMPEVFKVVPEEHLVEIGKINEDMFNKVLSLQLPNMNSLYGKLIRFSFNWGTNRLRKPELKNEKISYLRVAIEAAEEVGFAIKSYKRLKGLNRGKYTQDMKKMIYDHYRKVMDGHDLSVPEQVLRVARIINAFHLKPTDQLNQEIEEKLNKISLEGFSNQAAKLKAVMHGQFFPDNLEE